MATPTSASTSLVLTKALTGFYDIPGLPALSITTCSFCYLRPMQWPIQHLSSAAWVNIDVITRLSAAHVTYGCSWATEDLRQVLWASAVLGR